MTKNRRRAPLSFARPPNGHFQGDAQDGLLSRLPDALEFGHRGRDDILANHNGFAGLKAVGLPLRIAAIESRL